MLTNGIRIVLILSIFAILSSFVSESIAQQSDYNLVADPYQYENQTFKPWSNDMIRIGITTIERGLIFKITISNQLPSGPVEIKDLTIDVAVKKGDETINTFHKQISISYIYLPQDENYEAIVPVTFKSYDYIADYKAELTYTVGYNTENIEPYPFDFRVASEEQFQKEIEQKRTGPVVIIGPWEINIEVFGGGITITIVSIAFVLILWKRRRTSSES